MNNLLNKLDKKIQSNKTQIKFKYIARKHLREYEKECAYDKNKYSFREYLNKKRKNDFKLNKLIEEAEIDSDSDDSFNDFFNGKDKSEKQKHNIYYNKNIIQKQSFKTQFVINTIRGLMNKISYLDKKLN